MTVHTKAYAVRMDGRYWLVYAPTAALAKGLVIGAYGFAVLHCRRWRALDRSFGGAELCEWGYPGERDYETGAYIETPEPFQVGTQ